MTRTRWLLPIWTLLAVSPAFGQPADHFHDDRRDVSSWSALFGQTFEISTTRPSDPPRLKITSIVDGRAGGVGSELVGRSSDGEKNFVSIGDVMLLRNDQQLLRVRFDGRQRKFFFFDEVERLKQAEASLAKLGRRLIPILDPQADIAVIRYQREVLRETGKDPAFGIDEGRSSILLSDLPYRERKQVIGKLDYAIASVNAWFGLPPRTHAPCGKVIAILHTANRPPDEPAAGAVEGMLVDRLDEHGLGRPPQVVLRPQDSFDMDSTPQLCEQAAGEYALQIYSDQRLPLWLQVGLAKTVRYSVFPDPAQRKRELDHVRQQLASRGTVEATLAANDRADVDELLALSLTRLLINKRPRALKELLFDLKHGAEFEPALERNYGMNRRSLVGQFEEARHAGR